MGFIKEFKEFAMKGNVMDMAVGVIIGGAFGKIVSSLVDDILMPLVGVVTGNIDFTKLAVEFGEGDFAAKLTYGNFIQNVVDFLLDAERYQQAEPQEGRGPCSRGAQGSHAGRAAR